MAEETTLSPFQPTNTARKVTKEEFEKIKAMLGVECLFLVTDAKKHECDASTTACQGLPKMLWLGQPPLPSRAYDRMNHNSEKKVRQRGWISHTPYSFDRKKLERMWKYELQAETSLIEDMAQVLHLRVTTQRIWRRKHENAGEAQNHGSGA